MWAFFLNRALHPAPSSFGAHEAVIRIVSGDVMHADIKVQEVHLCSTAV